MRGFPVTAGLALAITAPAAADVPASERDAVIGSADAFMAAIANRDRTALTQHMIPEAMIFVHNRFDPDKPRVDIIPVTRHFENWSKRTADYEEQMSYQHVLIDGDMAQVWGAYSFTANGTLTHCGVNSLSMVRMEDGSWKVGNTSFSMVAPDQCVAVGADWVDHR